MTPDRFILNQVEYTTETHTHPYRHPCGHCAFGESPECHSAPDCMPPANQGRQVYFKRAERNDDLNFGEV